MLAFDLFGTLQWLSLLILIQPPHTCCIDLNVFHVHESTPEQWLWLTGVVWVPQETRLLKFRGQNKIFQASEMKGTECSWGERVC